MNVRLPENYDPRVIERLFKDLESRVLKSAPILTRYKSVALAAAANLKVNEAGYVLNDTQDADFIFKAEDGRLYRVSAIASESDSQVSEPSGAFVLKSGDTMTGLLILSGDPSAVLGAATKQYADTKVAKSTLTTKGDLFAYSTDVTRLGVGSAGQLLIPDSPSTTGLKWGNLVFTNDEIVANNDEIVTV